MSQTIAKIVRRLRRRPLPVTAPPVERATAAPGELRQTRVPRAEA
jgi:hypothetical protein